MKAPLPPDNPMPPPLPPTPDQVIIRKDYDPKGIADLTLREIICLVYMACLRLFI